MKSCITEYEIFDGYMTPHIFCPTCKLETNDKKMKVLSEKGTLSITVTVKCTCGTIAEYVS